MEHLTQVQNTLKDKLLNQIIKTIQIITFFSFCVVSCLELYLYQLNIIESKKQVKYSVQQRLGAIAKNSSIFINGSFHNDIFDSKDYLNLPFQTIKKQLLKIKKVNNLKDEIYTLRLEDEKSLTAKFIVMTGVNKQNLPYINRSYTFKPEMLKSFKNGEIIYTDIYTSSSNGSRKWMSVFAPFKEAEDEPYAVLEVDIAINNLLLEMDKKNKKVLSLHIARAIGIFLLLFLIQFFIKRKVTKVVLNDINKPLNLFMDHLNSIATNTHIKPLTLKTNDELQVLSQSFNFMMKKVSDSHEQLEDLNKNLEDKVITKTKSIKHLLDNTGQGFLSFDKSFKIQNEYSKECLNIFSTTNLTKHSIQNLLFNDPKEKDEFTDWMFRAFDQQLDFELVVDLAIKEIQFNNNFYSIEYRLLQNENHETIMMILTDITEQRDLENTHKKDQSYVKMILSVLRYQEQFRAFYEDFCNIEKDMDLLILNFKKLHEKSYFEKFFRDIHTLKGTAAAFDMIDLQDNLHILESYLQDKSYDLNKLKSFFKLIKTSFLKVINQLKEDLGDAIEFHQKRVFISENDFTKILNEIKLHNHQLYTQLSTYILNPISDLFEPYKLLIQQIADQQEKMLHPLLVEGEEILVNLNSYKDLNTSLVHLFRNAVDHGIESPEQRDEQGKDPEGSIKVIIKLDNNTIKIQVIDDGAGINPQFIAKSLIKKGLKSESEASIMSEKDLIHSIFLAGFSSKDSISNTSGRGVGMDAVKHAVKQLDGDIYIESEIGKGSKFFIEIPLLTI